MFALSCNIQFKKHLIYIYVYIKNYIIWTFKYLLCRLRDMNGIFIFGNPTTSVIAIGSNTFNIYRLSDALNTKGWNLNNLQFPIG